MVKTINRWTPDLTDWIYLAPDPIKIELVGKYKNHTLSPSGFKRRLQMYSFIRTQLSQKLPSNVLINNTLHTSDSELVTACLWGKESILDRFLFPLNLKLAQVHLKAAVNKSPESWRRVIDATIPERRWTHRRSVMTVVRSI